MDTDPDLPIPPNLHQRIIAASRAIGQIKATGRTAQGALTLSIEDVEDDIRDVLADHGIVTWPSHLGKPDLILRPQAKGGDYELWLLRMGIEFVNADDPADSKTVEAWDVGTSPSAAESFALKRCYKAVFHIATEEDEGAQRPSGPADAIPCPQCGNRLLQDRQNPSRYFCWAKRGGCGWQGPLPSEHGELRTPTTADTEEAERIASLGAPAPRRSEGIGPRSAPQPRTRNQRPVGASQALPEALAASLHAPTPPQPSGTITTLPPAEAKDLIDQAQALNVAEQLASQEVTAADPADPRYVAALGADADPSLALAKEIRILAVRAAHRRLQSEGKDADIRPQALADLAISRLDNLSQQRFGHGFDETSDSERALLKIDLTRITS